MNGQASSQRQLTLNIQLRDEATLDNYFALPGVEPLLLAIQVQSDVDGEPVVYLYGPEDTGKSHLLQAACHQLGTAALYLPLSDLASYSPNEVLQGIEAMSLVCLDDIEAVLGDEDWELALFHFYNRARDAGCRLLVSGPAAPRVLGVDLPDLRSRLSWGVVFQLTEPEDEAKQQILAFRAARRGLQMPTEVASYIVNRAPRDMSILLQLLDQLDAASLTEKRPLSIPFVKEQLSW
jgi:DnaA family protein